MMYLVQTLLHDGTAEAVAELVAAEKHQDQLPEEVQQELV